MKTLNSNTMIVVKPVNSDGRMPCWYADWEQGKTRKGCSWKVGVKGDTKEEYSFKASKVGDVNDDEIWNRLKSKEFAVDLMGKFKNGGQKAVKEWIKQGCP